MCTIFIGISMWDFLGDILLFSSYDQKTEILSNRPMYDFRTELCSVRFVLSWFLSFRSYAKFDSKLGKIWQTLRLPQTSPQFLKVVILSPRETVRCKQYKFGMKMCEMFIHISMWNFLSIFYSVFKLWSKTMIFFLAFWGNDAAIWTNFRTELSRRILYWIKLSQTRCNLSRFGNNMSTIHRLSNAMAMVTDTTAVHTCKPSDRLDSGHTLTQLSEPHACRGGPTPVNHPAGKPSGWQNLKLEMFDEGFNHLKQPTLQNLRIKSSS